jgi:heavy metal sensor kinase
MPRGMPVRWRLTLWYAAVVALILILFGGALFVGLRQQLYAGFDEQVRDQAAATLATVHFVGGEPALGATRGGEQEGEYFLRLLDPSGRVLFDNGDALGGVPFDRDAAAAALAGRTSLTSLSADDGEVLRIATVPVYRNGEDGPIVGALQFGLGRNDLDGVLAQLQAALLLATPVALVAAAAAGYVLAGRALAPVAAITALAAAIGGQDLRARLHLALPDDELGRLARTFDGMLDRIEDAFERQKRFTGDAAHELRTPLSLLRTRLELSLARPRTNEEYRETITEAEADVERLSGLVATLLTLARADAGRLSLERSHVDLAETVAAVGEQYALTAAEAGVTLAREAVSTPLVADEDLLLQVLVNLVDNALKHTPAGGQVTIGCRPDGADVRLWVEDTGVGIPEEHQARVFDRFYRVDTGRARAAGGTGLGLAMCHAIIAAHGGSIALGSRGGHGTRVEAILPATSPVA